MRGRIKKMETIIHAIIAHIEKLKIEGRVQRSTSSYAIHCVVVNSVRKVVHSHRKVVHSGRRVVHSGRQVATQFIA